MNNEKEQIKTYGNFEWDSQDGDKIVFVPTDDSSKAKWCFCSVPPEIESNADIDLYRNPENKKP